MNKLQSVVQKYVEFKANNPKILHVGDDSETFDILTGICEASKYVDSPDQPASEEETYDAAVLSGDDVNTGLVWDLIPDVETIIYGYEGGPLQYTGPVREPMEQWSHVYGSINFLDEEAKVYVFSKNALALVAIRDDLDVKEPEVTEQPEQTEQPETDGSTSSLFNWK
jgi:hypothetical protein